MREMRRSQRQKEKGTEDTQTGQTTAHSPLIRQGCNSHTHRQALKQPKHITAPFESVFLTGVNRTSLLLDVIYVASHVTGNLIILKALYILKYD